MRKKILSIFIVAATMCSLSACKKEEPPAANNVIENTITTSISSETATEETTPSIPNVEQDDDDEKVEGEDLIFDNSQNITWYIIENDKLIEKSESVTPDPMGMNIIDKLVEANMLIDGTKVLSFEKTIVSDGVGSNEDGIFEKFHREGTLNMCASFTDLINQEDESTQKLILEAIATSYKKSYDLDIVDIRCNGEYVMTDYINYNDIVEEERKAFISDDEILEFDACYEEVE